MSARRAAPLLAASLAFAGLAAAGDDLGKKLAEALKAKNDAAVQEACDALAKTDTKEALLALLGPLPKTEGAAYWSIVGAAASMKSQAALDELGRQIVALQSAARSPSGDLVFALQNHASKESVAPLAHVLEKGKYELQLMAANGLAQIREPASVDAVLAGWKREEKTDAELARRLKGAFVSLTGQSLDDPKAAEAWWKDHRSEPLAADKPIEKPRDREFKTVEKGAAGRILVLSGDRSALQGEDVEDDDYDKIQKILERRKIPHTVVFKYQLEKEPEKFFKDAAALLVNCNCIQSYCVCKKCNEGAVEKKEAEERFTHECDPKCEVHHYVNHRLSARTLAAIKKWVETEGGYLYTEDWGILEVLQSLWPERVGSGTREVTDEGIEDKPILIRARDKSGAIVKHFDVAVKPVRGATSHPLMRGVWQGQAGEKTTSGLPERRWTIDDESPAIEVHDKKEVVVLFESADLADLAKGATAVAVTFRPGAKGKVGVEPTKGTGEWVLARSGRVLHTLSHFGKQSGTQDGEALENLLVNFLLEAGRRKDAR